MLPEPYSNLEINTGYVLERMSSLRASGKSFADLAGQMVKPSGSKGISRAWLSRIIHNKVSNFTSEYIDMIAKYLDVPVSDMLRAAKTVNSNESS